MIDLVTTLVACENMNQIVGQHHRVYTKRAVNNMQHSMLCVSTHAVQANVQANVQCPYTFSVSGQNESRASLHRQKCFADQQGHTKKHFKVQRGQWKLPSVDFEV